MEEKNPRRNVYVQDIEALNLTHNQTVLQIKLHLKDYRHYYM